MRFNLQIWAGVAVLVEERRQKILDLVNEHGFISLGELAQKLNASESTIRRDLDYWGHQGFLKRTHGGAVVLDDHNGLPPLEERSARELEEKRAIAKTAAGRI